VKLKTELHYTITMAAANEMTNQSKKQKDEYEVCTVCSDIYTLIIRKKVTCKFCHASTCSKCIEYYLLGRHEDAHCLHCRVNYNDATLSEICTKTYLSSRYFKHRQEVLVNREKANLPGLQLTAIETRKQRERQKQIDEMNKDLAKLKEKRGEIMIEYSAACNAHYKAIRDGNPSDQGPTIDELQKHMDLYRDLIRQKTDDIVAIRHGVRENVKPVEEEEEKKKFIRRCTHNGCQGFLSTAWKCGICEWYSCSKCFAPKGKEHDVAHECKQDDVDTAELIKKDSKPCPNCGEFIMKTSGCDQMYCVCCQTPFSWNTGKIVTSGPIHNPHYYEWMKRNGASVPRNPADVPCGGFPNLWELRRFPRGMKSAVTSIYYEFHRICQELQEMSTRSYRSHLDATAWNYINVQFLLNDFDEKHWGRVLAIQEKKKKRDAEIQEVFAAFRMIAVDIINRIQNYSDSKYNTITDTPVAIAEKLVKDLRVEISGFITMINDAMRLISISYAYSVPYIKVEYNKTESITYYMVDVKNFKEEIKKKKKQAEDVVKPSAADAADAGDAADASAASIEQPVIQIQTYRYRRYARDSDSELEEHKDEEQKDEDETLNRAILASLIESYRR